MSSSEFISDGLSKTFTQLNQYSTSYFIMENAHNEKTQLNLPYLTILKSKGAKHRVVKIS